MRSEGTTLAQLMAAGARKRSLVLQHGFSSTRHHSFLLTGANHHSDWWRLMKALSVEDHPGMRDLLSRIVERMGYVPVSAGE
jgi:hypothetical protein